MPPLKDIEIEMIPQKKDENAEAVQNVKVETKPKEESQIKINKAELEQAVIDAKNEMLEKEKAEEERFKKVQQKAKEKKEVEKMPITNDNIYDKLLQIEKLGCINNKDILEANKQDYKFSKAILEETHFIRKNIGKHNNYTYLAMFVTGTVFGMIDQKWLPFIDVIWKLANWSK